MQLQALWSAEKMLTEALPELIENATNPGLKKNLAFHLAETREHQVAIEAICKQLEYSYEGAPNEEMKKILEEGQRTVLTEISDKKMDAAIIAGAIKVEHYEIEKYTAIGDTVEALGYEGIAQRLRRTLEEERQADTKLNFLQKELVLKTAEIGAEGLALK